MTTTTKPTLLEELRALEVTAHRLATERDRAVAKHADLLEANRQLQAERDCALKMAGQATKDLVRARNEMQARIDVRDVLIKSLRAHADTQNSDNRQLTARVHELTVANENPLRQHEQDQQEPKPTRKFWLPRRFGNRP